MLAAPGPAHQAALWGSSMTLGLAHSSQKRDSHGGIGAVPCPACKASGPPASRLIPASGAKSWFNAPIPTAHRAFTNWDGSHLTPCLCCLCYCPCWRLDRLCYRHYQHTTPTPVPPPNSGITSKYQHHPQTLASLPNISISPKYQHHPQTPASPPNTGITPKYLPHSETSASSQRPHTSCRCTRGAV